jgi:sugar lactone lactonase YvrE
LCYEIEYYLSMHKKLTIILSPLVLIIPLLVILVSTINVSATTTNANQWGTEGSGNGQFESPGNVAVDSSGNVFVADTSNHRIQEFDSSGNYLAQFGLQGSGNGQFESPTDIAVDSSSNVYVADSGNQRIQKFDSTGNYLTQWGLQGTNAGQFSSPSGLFIDTSDKIYVADTGNNRIQEFNASGSFIAQFGSQGSGNGQFDTPMDLAVDTAGNIYVADTNNSRIQKFDNSGNYLTKWGSVGSSTGLFQNPKGIATDLSGNVYVADTGNNRIQRFDSVGTFEIAWGSTGASAGEFNTPSGVSPDLSGNVYVADTGNHRIQKFAVNFDSGAYSSIANPNTYQGASSVYALLKVGNTVYLGGSFGLEAINATNGAQIVWASGISSPVYALSYSNNTLYVGMQGGLEAFDTTSDTGTLIPWTPDIERDTGGLGIVVGDVHALEVVDNKLYAGGFFTSVDGNPRVSLASFDISTPSGVITSWTADLGSSEQASVIKDLNGVLYVGGNFNTIQGINQPVLAAIATDSGNINSSFNPVFDTSTSPYVKTIAYYNNKIYAGGSFSTINNNNGFHNITALDVSNGAPDFSWTPTINSGVYALTVNGNYLYVGESNQSFSGDSISGGKAEAYNLQTGLLSDWDPQGNESVQVMIADDNALYIGMSSNQGSGYKGSTIKPFAFLPFHFPIAEAATKEKTNTDNLLADIGGITGTIFLAEFDPLSIATVTPSPLPTPTPGSSSSNSSTSNPQVCSDQKPGTPTGLTATAGPASDQITLSWTAPADPVTDYSITYSDDPNVRKWGVVSTGKVTTYTISNLDSSVKYYFWVNAVNGCMPGDAAGYATIASGTLSASGISSSSAASSGSLANPSIALNPLPVTGSKEIIVVGGAGVVMTILGALLMLAL